MDLQHWLMLVGAIVLVLGIGFWDRVYLKFRQYIALPIRARHDTIAMRRDRTPIDLTQLPAELAPTFHQVARELAACGFQAVGHFYNQRAGSRLNSQGWVSVWAGPDNMTTAQVIGVQVQAPGRPQRNQTSFVLRSAFPDGTELAVSSSRSPTVFLRDPRIDSVRWAGMCDFNVLWQLHQARLAQRLVSERPLPPPSTQEQAERYQDQLQAQVMAVQVRGGYFTEDAAVGVYRRTLRGSFLMTWHLLWPWKGIIERANRRKLARVVAEVRMGRPEDYPLIPPAQRNVAAPAEPGGPQ